MISFADIKTLLNVFSLKLVQCGAKFLYMNIFRPGLFNNYHNLFLVSPISEVHEKLLSFAAKESTTGATNLFMVGSDRKCLLSRLRFNSNVDFFSG